MKRIIKFIKPFKLIFIFLLLLQGGALLLALKLESFFYTLKAIFFFNLIFSLCFIFSVIRKKVILEKALKNSKNLSEENDIFLAFTGDHFVFEDNLQVLIFPSNYVVDTLYENETLSISIRYPLGGYLTLAPERISAQVKPIDGEQCLSWFKKKSSSRLNRAYALIIRDPIGRFIFIVLASSLIILIAHFLDN